MACFTVSAAEAVIVSAVKKIEEKKELKAAADGIREKEVSIPLSRKLGWLRNMLGGGSALLAFEHIWHGEISPWFPFLTAMSNKADTIEMLNEIATVGVSMAVLITAVWAVICKAADVIVKRGSEDSQKSTV
ncbi:MAG: hypothetical protein K5894_13145 [Lachnospiraceae bacterium]|nr:hypothetical protein [Lachnospiraceae bacterium]